MTQALCAHMNKNKIKKKNALSFLLLLMFSLQQTWRNGRTGSAWK
jgi:hypothetical protein